MAAVAAAPAAPAAADYQVSASAAADPEPTKGTPLAAMTPTAGTPEAAAASGGAGSPGASPVAPVTTDQPRTGFWYDRAFNGFRRFVVGLPAYQTASTKVAQLIDENGLSPRVEQVTKFLSENRRVVTAGVVALAVRSVGFGWLFGDGFFGSVLDTTLSVGAGGYAVHEYGRQRPHQA